MKVPGHLSLADDVVILPWGRVRLGPPGPPAPLRARLLRLALRSQRCSVAKEPCMKVLGIETSCDETAAAVVEDGRRALSDVVADADRDPPALGRRGPRAGQPQPRGPGDAGGRRGAHPAPGSAPDDLDGIAVTARPGAGGRAAGRACRWPRRWRWPGGKPLVGVNHLEGHLLAAFLGEDAPAFPSSGSSSPAGTPRSTRREASATTGCSARPATTPPARPSTRSRSCSACRTRAAWPSTGWRSEGDRAAVHVPAGRS